MRIGLTHVYPFRPHVEHLFFLGQVLEGGGHECIYLDCRCGLDSCYSKLLRDFSAARECVHCRLGGIRTYPVDHTMEMDPDIRMELPPERKEEMAISSAATICRTESPVDKAAEEVQQTQRALYEPLEVAYGNAVRWIQEAELEGVVCYNGRMAATRAIIEACRDLDVPFLTYERSWLGDGLRLIPQENCLSLKELHRMTDQFRDRPLTARQARYAAGLIAQRFEGTQRGEWRVYNTDRESVSWPVEVDAGPRTLILPSSWNELDGHPEWSCDWADYTRPLDRLLDALAISPEKCVLRCHPNWGQLLGKNTGWRSERHYRDWASERGVYTIPSEASANTYDLIQQADLVVVNGSTTGLEAAAVGTPVVCIGHSFYEVAGFAHHITTWDQFEELDLGGIISAARRDLSRQALRFLYLRARRYPRFADEVVATSASEYTYYDGAASESISHLFRTGRLEPYDEEVASSRKDEDEVVQQVLDGRWETLLPHAVWARPRKREEMRVKRRPQLQWVDALRRVFPRGDR